jgi:flagellar motility protein MotE (MotC chaperone)
MDSVLNWLIANWEGVAGLLGIVVSAAALWQKGAEARRTAKVKQAADAISGYSNLCNELQEELAIDRAYRKQLEERIKTLEMQIGDLRRELDAEKRDNVLLRERIRVLEDEREKLKAELEALRNKAGA